jgi:hypothetical protein
MSNDEAMSLAVRQTKRAKPTVAARTEAADPVEQPGGFCDDIAQKCKEFH